MQESVSAAPRKAGIGAYIALVFAVIFFSGISVSKPVQDFGTVIAEKVGVEPKKVHDIFSVFDFNTLNGKFGKVAVPETADKAASGHGSANFSGQGGAGARDGFMFALTLMPTTLFAMGIIAVLEHYGALEAMRRLLQRILKPLMGIPKYRCGRSADPRTLRRGQDYRAGARYFRNVPVQRGRADYQFPLLRRSPPRADCGRSGGRGRGGKSADLDWRLSRRHLYFQSHRREPDALLSAPRRP